MTVPHRQAGETGHSLTEGTKGFPTVSANLIIDASVRADKKLEKNSTADRRGAFLPYQPPRHTLG